MKKIHINKPKDIKNKLFLTRNRWGNYEVLTLGQYERKLIYG